MCRLFRYRSGLAAHRIINTVVFVNGLVDGLLPHKNGDVEERRICFVGISRAMRLLYLTYAGRVCYLISRQSSVGGRVLSSAESPPVASVKKRKKKTFLFWQKKHFFFNFSVSNQRFVIVKKDDVASNSNTYKSTLLGNTEK